MAYTRKVGASVTAYSVGGVDILAVIEGCTLNVEIKTEDAGAVRDGWEYNLPVGAAWSVDSDAFVADFPALMAEAIGSDRMVTVSINTGAGVYTGDAVVKSANHQIGRSALQKHKFQLVGHGPLAVA